MLYHLLHHNPMNTCISGVMTLLLKQSSYRAQAEGLDVDKIGSAANACLVAADVRQAGGEEDVVGRVPRNYKKRYLSSLNCHFCFCFLFVGQLLLYASLGETPSAK